MTNNPTITHIILPNENAFNKFECNLTLGLEWQVCRYAARPMQVVTEMILQGRHDFFCIVEDCISTSVLGGVSKEVALVVF